MKVFEYWTCFLLSFSSINDIPLFYAAKKNSVGCIKKLLSCPSTNIFERGETELCPLLSQSSSVSVVVCETVIVSPRSSRGDRAPCCRDDRQPGSCCGSDGRSSWTHQRAHDVRALPRSRHRNSRSQKWAQTHSMLCQTSKLLRFMVRSMDRLRWDIRDEEKDKEDGWGKLNPVSYVWFEWH